MTADFYIDNDIYILYITYIVTLLGANRYTFWWKPICLTDFVTLFFIYLLSAVKILLSG